MTSLYFSSGIKSPDLLPEARSIPAYAKELSGREREVRNSEERQHGERERLGMLKRRRNSEARQEGGKERQEMLEGRRNSEEMLVGGRKVQENLSLHKLCGRCGAAYVKLRFHRQYCRPCP